MYGCIAGDLQISKPAERSRLQFIDRAASQSNGVQVDNKRSFKSETKTRVLVILRIAYWKISINISY